MKKELSIKLESARIVNRHFSKGAKVKLGENQYISGLSFLDNAKGMLADLLPDNVSSDITDGAVYAEVDPSTIQIKTSEKDVLNKGSNFFVVMDMGKKCIAVLDKSGNCLYYNSPSIKSFKTVLYGLPKFIGDDAALKQLGFK